MKFLKSAYSILVMVLCMIFSCGTAFAADAASSVMSVAEFISIPWIAILILAIGFAGLFKEIVVPGDFIGGIIAVFFLGFFFGIKVAAGQAEILVILLLIAGIILAVLEAYVVTGFGITGISSLVCFGAGTVMCCRNLTEGFLVLIGICLCASALLWAVFSYLIKEDIFARFSLKVKNDEPSVDIPEVPVFDIGMIGTTLCSLRPGGKAMFGTDKADVSSKGEFIEKDRNVEIIDIEGNMIFVKEVKE